MPFTLAWEPDLRTSINPFHVSPGQYAATGRVLVLESGQDSAEGIVRHFHERPSLMERVRQGESYSNYRNTLAELRRRQEASPADFRGGPGKGSKGNDTGDGSISGSHRELYSY